MVEKENIAANVIKQGSILAFTSIVVRVIGLIYRIPMANIIGEQAMGIYSASFEVYNIVLILSSYSMPLAVSRLMSIFMAKGEIKNAYKMLLNAFIYALVVGNAGKEKLYHIQNNIRK